MLLTTTIKPSRSNLKNKIATVCFKDEKTKNAFSCEFIQELQEIIKNINEEDSIAAVILTGFDNVFCSGGNVKEIINPENTMFGGSAEEIAKKYREGIQMIPLALSTLQVPIIAAVNGYAIGGGFDLALMCDIRIASDRAVFSERFINLGLVSGDGGFWYLSRLIGYSNAAYLSLTGDKIIAAKAMDMGIVTSVVSHESLQQEVEAIAANIAENPVSALRRLKPY